MFFWGGELFSLWGGKGGRLRHGREENLTVRFEVCSGFDNGNYEI
jgi:hypothetical protein